MAEYFAESQDGNKRSRWMKLKSSLQKREDKGQDYSYPNNVYPDTFKKLFLY